MSPHTKHKVEHLQELISFPGGILRVGKKAHPPTFPGNRRVGAENKKNGIVEKAGRASRSCNWVELVTQPPSHVSSLLQRASRHAAERAVSVLSDIRDTGMEGIGAVGFLLEKI
jgi:hypothetical protein